MSRILDRFTLPATITTSAVSGTDEYGNPSTTPTSAAVFVHARQVTADERAQNIDREQWVVYAAPEVVIDADATVTIAGLVYVVDGPPRHVRNPRSGIVEAISARMSVTT